MYFWVREQGIKAKNLDLTSGNITVNLNENMLLKAKKKPEASVGSTLVTTAIKKTENNEVSSLLRKPIIPEKVCILPCGASVVTVWSFVLPVRMVLFNALGCYMLKMIL